ncbi:MAG: hypothetical protein AB1758_31140, partial [Candidatus Eremiobacterota bacterium]
MQVETLAGRVVQELDLSHVELPPGAGQAVFLGCRLSEGQVAGLTREGALILSPFRDLPYRPFRTRLYDWRELLEGFSEERDESLDRRIYDYFV